MCVSVHLWTFAFKKPLFVDLQYGVFIRGFFLFVFLETAAWANPIHVTSNHMIFLPLDQILSFLDVVNNMAAILKFNPEIYE